MWEKDDDFESILLNKVNIPGLVEFNNKNYNNDKDIYERNSERYSERNSERYSEGAERYSERNSYVYNPSKKRTDSSVTPPKPTAPQSKFVPSAPNAPVINTGKLLGKLTVKILRGENIKTGKSIFGAADPYAVLVIGGQKKQTTVKSAGGQNPIWDEEVIFDITNEDTLSITIFDKETTDEDRFMAQCSCSILDWIEHGSFEGSLNLVDKKNKLEGSLLISTFFVHTSEQSENVGTWM